MTGEEFEAFVASKLVNLGWEVNHTPKSNDFGADLICNFSREKIIVQCKSYADDNYVGVSSIQEAYSSNVYYDGSIPMVIYRGRISRNAIKMAEKLGVHTVHESEVVLGWIFDRSKDKILKVAADKKDFFGDTFIRYETSHGEYMKLLNVYYADLSAYFNSPEKNKWNRIDRTFNFMVFGGIIIGVISKNEYAAIFLTMLLSFFGYVTFIPDRRPEKPTFPWTYKNYIDNSPYKNSPEVKIFYSNIVRFQRTVNHFESTRIVGLLHMHFSKIEISIDGYWKVVLDGKFYFLSSSNLIDILNSYDNSKTIILNENNSFMVGNFETDIAGILRKKGFMVNGPSRERRIGTPNGEMYENCCSEEMDCFLRDLRPKICEKCYSMIKLPISKSIFHKCPNCRNEEVHKI